MASIRSLARTAQCTARCAPLRPAAAAATHAPVPWRASSTASASQSVSASTAPAPAAELDYDDLELDSSFQTPGTPEPIADARPSRDRSGRKLPGSRYQFHPPKYDRGPLHPIQAPPASDPTARDFVPGPFHNPRLRQTYHTSLASDLMTLTYQHKPPGTVDDKDNSGRLRGWDGSSPYHKNRPLRGPRGSPYLPLLEKDITFRNIPALLSVTVAAYVPEAIREPDRLAVARAVLQTMTGAKPLITKVRRNVAQWHIVKGQAAGCKVTLHGNAAYDFFDKCVHLVLPRIKDWPGVRGSTGDNAGNLSFGLSPLDVALFPEIESTYTMYPSKMIPGCRIFVQTTARSDRHARLLLGSLGLPFTGELVN